MFSSTAFYFSYSFSSPMLTLPSPSMLIGAESVGILP